MQIVIDIPEERYKDILRIADIQHYRRTLTLEQIVKIGTPLPTGHGDLIDRDGVLANLEAAGVELSCGYGKGLHEAWEIVRDKDATPVILKAEGSKA